MKAAGIDYEYEGFVSPESFAASWQWLFPFTRGVMKG